MATRSVAQALSNAAREEAAGQQLARAGEVARQRAVSLQRPQRFISAGLGCGAGPAAVSAASVCHSAERARLSRLRHCFDASGGQVASSLARKAPSSRCGTHSVRGIRFEPGKQVRASLAPPRRLECPANDRAGPAPAQRFRAAATSAASPDPAAPSHSRRIRPRQSRAPSPRPYRRFARGFPRRDNTPTRLCKISAACR